MQEKLNEMHRSDFVHGDIREANIMVSKGRKTSMFLDSDANRVDFQTGPDGALDGELFFG